MRDLAALEHELKERPPQVIHFEPVSNPSLDVLNVPEIIRMAHAAGAKVVVDSTWLTPALIRPLELGADIVAHSCTKYMGGHGDAMGGVIVHNDKAFGEALFRTKAIFGGCMSPFNAYNILKGVSTLALRMKQHGENAMLVAELLTKHPAVAEVRYPGLPTDTGHALAKELFGKTSGYSGMLGFVIKGGEPAQKIFGPELKVVKPWISLGDLYSLAYLRWPEERKGVPPGFIRVSVGLEDIADILADIDQALKASQAGV